MRMDAINKIALLANPQTIEINKIPETSFINWLSEKISSTNDQLNNADTALKELANGHAINLHQSMLTLEEAKLSLHYLAQIRNRLLSAYQDLLREQI